MNVIPTELDGVVIIEPRIFGDERGYFFESFNESEFMAKVCDTKFVQDNQSKSCYGVLRGLHFQRAEMAQAKLVRVTQGAVLDVAVDIRPGSATYGRYVAVELTAQNQRQLFIPRGFAHGFAVLSAEAIFQYKCDNYYSKEHEGSLLFSDPAIGIDWQLPRQAIILSAKDRVAPKLSEI